MDDALPSGFAEYMGTEWLAFGPTTPRPVARGGPAQAAPGIVHGGVYATLAESLPAATYAAVRDDGLVAIAQANSTTFLRPVD